MSDSSLFRTESSTLHKWISDPSSESEWSADLLNRTPAIIKDPEVLRALAALVENSQQHVKLAWASPLSTSTPQLHGNSKEMKKGPKESELAVVVEEENQNDRSSSSTSTPTSDSTNSKHSSHIDGQQEQTLESDSILETPQSSQEKSKSSKSQVSYESRIPSPFGDKLRRRALHGSMAREFSADKLGSTEVDELESFLQTSTEGRVMLNEYRNFRCNSPSKPPVERKESNQPPTTPQRKPSKGRAPGECEKRVQTQPAESTIDRLIATKLERLDVLENALQEKEAALAALVEKLTVTYSSTKQRGNRNTNKHNEVDSDEEEMAWQENEQQQSTQNPSESFNNGGIDQCDDVDKLSLSECRSALRNALNHTKVRLQDMEWHMPLIGQLLREKDITLHFMNRVHKLLYDSPFPSQGLGIDRFEPYCDQMYQHVLLLRQEADKAVPMEPS